MLEKLLKNKLKNMDEEILKLLKEKISINLEINENLHQHNYLDVSILYKDDQGKQHVISTSSVKLPL